MAMNSRGLGRGIQALFDGNAQTMEAKEADSPLLSVSPDLIFPNPGQPREVFSQEKLEELAESIRQHGVLQPLLARPGNSAGTYQLIAGERRLRAAQIAGLKEVPIIVRPLNDQDALIVTLLENLQREDLNPIEEAKGLEALRQAMNTTIEGLADALGQARSTISNALRLLRLDAETQKEVAAMRLSPSHAKALASLPQGEPADNLRKRVLANGMTSRETEEAVAFWHDHGYFPWQADSANFQPQVKQRPKMPQDENLVKLAKDIGHTLNCRAKINGSQEKGKISITYESNAQLFDLLDKLGLTLNS